MLHNVGTKNIETSRLILRKFEYDDSEAVFTNYACDEEVQSFYCEPTYSSKEEVQELLKKYLSNYENSNYYRWAIALKETNECIGQIAYFMVDENNNFAEIEYCIGSRFQGRGYATEAAKAIIEFGFKEMNLHKIQICHKSNNIKSKRVIEKCGFIYEGRLRDFFFVKGQYIDRLYYSILQDEYNDLK